jgi:hypothetical protein
MISEMNRERREVSKYVKIFKFGGVLKLRCGGATTDHHTGKIPVVFLTVPANCVFPREIERVVAF